MAGIYGVTPVLVLRDPEEHEMGSRCNVCLAPNVTSVLETGNAWATTLTRLCGQCTRILKAKASAFTLPELRLRDG